MATRRRTVLGTLAGSAARAIAGGWSGRSCEDNLRAIHEAVILYRRLRGRLPDSLSELIPLGMIDPELLICPHHKAAGTSRPADPSQPSNFSEDPMTLYFWEFGGRTADVGGRPQESFFLRELHERQMRMGLGDRVPIVRCDQHPDAQGNTHLNITLGGAVFRSGKRWEARVTHLVPYPYLCAGKMIGTPDIVPLAQRIPSRSPEATSRQLDLAPAFNGAFDDPWTEGYPDDGAPEFLALAGASRILSHAGVSFEIRGVVQLEGSLAFRVHRASEGNSIEEARFPRRSRRIAAGVTASALHLLCGVVLPSPSGTGVGKMTAEAEDGEKLSLSLLYGRHCVHGQTLEADAEASVVWSREAGRRSIYAPLSISHVVWRLGTPRRLASLRFEASDCESSPFLVAVTAE